MASFSESGHEPEEVEILKDLCFSILRQIEVTRNNCFASALGGIICLTEACMYDSSTT